MAEEQGGPSLPPKLNLKKSASNQTAPIPDEGIRKENTDVTPKTPDAAEKPRLQIRPPGGAPAPVRLPVKTPSAVPPAPVTPPAAEPKSKTETMRIEIPAAEPAVPAAPADAVEAPAPVRLRPQPAPPVASQKKETSRIPLEAAKPAVAAVPGISAVGPKTIRIKPVASPPTVKVATPAAPPQPEATVGEMAEKRKTSRISLESALAASDTAVEAASPVGAGAPKTIRLKRPSEAATVKVQRPPAAEAEEAGKSAMSKTARLDESVSTEVEGATPTRRKTIKVKRPNMQTSVKGLAIARPEGEEPEVQLFTEPEFGGVVEDRPSWFFSLVAVAAILVACVLIYVLMAQACGPNVSLTQLSYGAPGLDLSWPGKLVMQ